MPSVSSLDALERAVAGFEVRDLGLVIDPPARAAARRSLDESGLLLLGEVHGVRENPLVIRALMQAFGLNALALEWPDQLAPVIAGYLTGGVLADHPALWLGDGRITAGHLAMLSERAAAGGDLDLTLFDRVADAGWTWSQRDEAMAEVILARTASVPATRIPGPDQPTWVCRSARAWPGSDQASWTSASATAAGGFTTSARAGSRATAAAAPADGAAPDLARSACTCCAVGSSSTFRKPARLPSRTGPSQAGPALSQPRPATQTKDLNGGGYGG